MPEAGSPDVPVPVAAVPEDPGWLPSEINTGAAPSARVYDDPIVLAHAGALMASLLADADDPRGIVAELMGALPPGGYLAITHATADFNPGEIARVAEATRHAVVTFAPRTQAEVAAFSAGLDLVDPGVAPVLAWRPDDGVPDDPRAAYNYAATGRKP